MKHRRHRVVKRAKNDTLLCLNNGPKLPDGVFKIASASEDKFAVKKLWTVSAKSKNKNLEHYWAIES